MILLLTLLAVIVATVVVVLVEVEVIVGVVDETLVVVLDMVVVVEDTVVLVPVVVVEEIEIEVEVEVTVEVVEETLVVVLDTVVEDAVVLVPVVVVEESEIEVEVTVEVVEEMLVVVLDTVVVDVTLVIVLDIVVVVDEALVVVLLIVVVVVVGSKPETSSVHVGSILPSDDHSGCETTAAVRLHAAFVLPKLTDRGNSNTRLSNPGSTICVSTCVDNSVPNNVTPAVQEASMAIVPAASPKLCKTIDTCPSAVVFGDSPTSCALLTLTSSPWHDRPPRNAADSSPAPAPSWCNLGSAKIKLFLVCRCCKPLPPSARVMRMLTSSRAFKLRTNITFGAPPSPSSRRPPGVVMFARVSLETRSASRGPVHDLLSALHLPGWAKNAARVTPSFPHEAPTCDRGRTAQLLVLPAPP